MFQSNAVLKSILDSIKTSILLVGGGAGFKVKLAVAPFAPTPNSVPSTDFTEATFTGYAAVTLTAMAADQFVGNTWESVATTLANFASTGTAVTNSVVGYWLESNTGELLGYDTFTPAIGFNGPGDALNLAVRWQVQPAQWPNTIIP